MKVKPAILFFALIFSLGFSVSAKTKDLCIKEDIAGGIIKGRLLDAAGKPRPYTELELVSVEAKKKSDDMRLWAITTSNGIFIFKNVPAGKYTLSINFNESPTNNSPYSTHFYPNTAKRSDAKVFDVTAESNFSQLVFRLPASHKMKSFTGKIVWEDGEPVVDALVSLVDMDAQSDTGFGRIKSDAKGIFKITGFIGRKYQIAAILFDGDLVKDANPQLLAQGFSKMFYLDAKTNIIKITLKRPGTDEDSKKGLVGQLIK